MDETKTIQQLISIFLENGALDYNYGISLLEKVSNKKPLIENLKRKNSDQNNSKLIYELEKHLIDQKYNEPLIMSNEPLPEPKKPVIIDFIKPEVVKKEYSEESDLGINQAIKKLQDAKKELYGIRDYLHPQLSLVTDDDERFEIAKKIQKIQPSLDLIQSQIDSIKKNGYLPAIVAAKTLSAADYQRLALVKSYVRRYRLLVEASTTLNDKRKYQELLDKYENELKLIQ